MVKNKTKQKGFSLVELSIVLIIIALLIAGIISGKSLINNAKLTTLHSEMQTLHIAIKSYINDRGGKNLKKLSDTDKIMVGLEKTGYLDEGNIVDRNGKFYSSSQSQSSGSDYPDYYFKSKYNGGLWDFDYYDLAYNEVILYFGSKPAEGETYPDSFLDVQLCETFKTRFHRPKQIEIEECDEVVNGKSYLDIYFLGL